MSEINLHSIKALLDSVLQKQEELATEVREIHSNLKDISQTVIGNEKLGHTGLVQQVKSLNDYVEKDKIRDAKIVGGLTIVGVLWTIFLKLFNFK